MVVVVGGEGTVNQPWRVFAQGVQVAACSPRPSSSWLSSSQGGGLCPVSGLIFLSSSLSFLVWLNFGHSQTESCDAAPGERSHVWLILLRSLRPVLLSALLVPPPRNVRGGSLSKPEQQASSVTGGLERRLS